MKKLLGLFVVSLVALVGCPAKSPVGKTPIVRPAGQWQNTTVQVQKYRNAVFRDKATGKQLEPDAVLGLAPSATYLEAGDFDEVIYSKGRVRYAFYGRNADEQPYVVDRAVTEPEFEALDEAVYADGFFKVPERSWDEKARIPLFVVRYNQADKGWEASFTPNMNRLTRTNALFTGYMDQLSGTQKMPVGVTHFIYALLPDAAGLKLSLSSATPDAEGDAVEKPLALKSAEIDLGMGFQAATLSASKTSFTFPQGTGTEANAFQLVGLKLTPEGATAPWQTLVPVRLKR